MKLFGVYNYSSKILRLVQLMRQMKIITKFQYNLKWDNKIIILMQQDIARPDYINQSNCEDRIQRHQIINSLLLKKSIVEYESHSFDVSQHNQQSLKAKALNISKNQNKPSTENIYGRAKSNVKTTEKGKCQSQRLLKKMKTIDYNRKQLLRGNSQKIHSDHLLSLQQEQKSTIKSFSRSALKGKHSNRVLRKTQSVMYPQQNAILTLNDFGGDRMNMFMDKYKNRQKVQRNKIGASDKQYQQIQNILNRIQSKTQKLTLQMTQGIDSQAKQELNPQSLQVNKNGSEGKAKGKGRSIAQVKLEIKARMHLHKQLQGNKILKDRYQILERIGKGLSGEVYKGKDILSERFVAIKVLINNPINQQHQFYKKIQHPNIVSYYNGFAEKDKKYLILQYFPHTLSKIARQRKFQQNQIKRIFKNISNGLVFLHGISIAHRDIKLDNIVISEDLNVVKFIDFGLCLDINESENQWSTDFCGTVHYMPPQILSKKQYAPKKADIWSLGILLYKLAFQRYPYRGKDERQVLQKIYQTKLVFPESCNENLKGIISGMLIRNPNNRYSILDVAEHIWLQ